LGRTESHVFDAVQTVYEVLSALLGSDASLPAPAEPAVGECAELLEQKTEATLGPPPSGRTVRVMPADAATDYELVRDLTQSGMDCMRINCAHDNADVWLGMIRSLQAARQETGRACRILVDLSDPKLRTGDAMTFAAPLQQLRLRSDTYPGSQTRHLLRLTKHTLWQEHRWFLPIRRRQRNRAGQSMGSLFVNCSNEPRFDDIL
jgi:hypothetical protein